MWAKAATRLGHMEQAALEAMKVVILYERDHEELVPEGLALAYENLKRLDRRDEAASVLYELLERFPESEVARAIQASGSRNP